MTESLSIKCAALVGQSLRSVADGRPAARAWFATHGKAEEAMSAAALAVGTAYVDGRLTYSAGSSFMNLLMALAEWEAPKIFWSIYVAFEDFEIKEEPGSEAVQHVAEVLASVRQAIAPAHAQPGSAPQ
jgi:hypothetical protein